MTVKIEYKVVEDCDNYLEDFGFVQLEERPKEGDVIQLYWLGGEKAYKVKIVHIRHPEGLTTLLVEKVEDSVATTIS